VGPLLFFLGVWGCGRKEGGGRHEDPCKCGYPRPSVGSRVNRCRQLGLVQSWSVRASVLPTPNIL